MGILYIGNKEFNNNYVTIEDPQEITGSKLFDKALQSNSYLLANTNNTASLMLGGGENEYVWFDCRQNGELVNNFMMFPTYTLFTKSLQASSFVKTGGLSTELLKADGNIVSIDNFPRIYHLGTNLDTKPFYIVLSKGLTTNNEPLSLFNGNVMIVRGSVGAYLINIFITVSVACAYHEETFNHQIISSYAAGNNSIPIYKRKIKYKDNWYQAIYIDSSLAVSQIKCIGYSVNFTPFIINDTSTVTEYKEL